MNICRQTVAFLHLPPSALP